MWLVKKLLELSLLMLGVILLLAGLSSSLYSLVSIIAGMFLPSVVGAALALCCLWGGWYLVIGRPARLIYEGRRKLGWYGAHKTAPATRMKLYEEGKDVSGHLLRSEAEKMAAFKGITSVPVLEPRNTRKTSLLAQVAIIGFLIFNCVTSIMLAERFFSPALKYEGIAVILVGEWILLGLVMWWLGQLKSRLNRYLRKGSSR